MKLGISGFATDGGKSGISQYIINVVPRLAQLDADVDLVIFMPRSEAYLLSARVADGSIITTPDWVAHPVANILWHLLIFPLLLRRHKCDCAFLPAGNRRLGWYYGIPSVATIHDLSQLHIAEKYSPLRMFYIRQVLPAMFARLTRIVSVSESTRRDLLEYGQLPAARIRVAYNGADLERFTSDDRAAARQRASSFLGHSKPYLLYTSRLEHPGKNHVGLLRAVALLKQHGNLHHRIVFAGSRWSNSEVIDSAIEELGVTDEVMVTGFVPNEILPDLYAGADVFVFPSLYEGFGIPVLEAMMSGTPVCAANVASIPEVTGDAALLFDPADPAAIAQQIDRLLSEPELAQTLVKRGFRQARRFSWDQAASGVLQQCREAIAA
jgi:glycosyltransferase involved in cell wall biosynthesis